MRLAISTALLLLAALAACDEASPRPGTGNDGKAPPAASLPPVEPAAGVDSLAGEWRVAAIDGRSFDEPVGLALSGDDQQLWWAPRCAGVARTYLIQGTTVSFGSTEPPMPAGSPPPPVCSIGLPPRLRDVVRALDDAVSIRRTPSNGVIIAGPNHDLTLYSQ